MDLARPLLLHSLSLEPGVNYVDHLSAEIDEEDGQSPVRHGVDEEEVSGVTISSSEPGSEPSILAREWSLVSRATTIMALYILWESQHKNKYLNLDRT